MSRRKQAGFSLIELLVVVVIILIVAAIAVPNYLSSRMAANEASAVGCLRTISSALMVYTTSYASVGYPATLSNLSDGGAASNCTPPSIPTAAHACIIDANLAGGVKSGYRYTYAPDASIVPSPSYTVSADPISRRSTGRRSFFTNVPGIIHWNATAPATEADPSIPM